jgi:hypothetical protein
MYDEARAISPTAGVVDYDRSTKWRCANGHLSFTTVVISAEALAYHPERSSKLSVKRFHKKGFQGHNLPHTRALRPAHRKAAIMSRREASLVAKYGGVEALHKKRIEWGAKADQSKGGKASPQNFKNNRELASRAGAKSKRSSLK